MASYSDMGNGRCSGIINSDSTVKHVMPRNVTSGSTVGNGVFCAVCADFYIMQHSKNYGSSVSYWVRL
jgi:hypothetical protein